TKQLNVFKYRVPWYFIYRDTIDIYNVKTIHSSKIKATRIILIRGFTIELIVLQSVLFCVISECFCVWIKLRYPEISTYPYISFMVGFNPVNKVVWQSFLLGKMVNLTSCYINFIKAFCCSCPNIIF